MNNLNWQDNFSYSKIKLQDDYEGKVIATLIEHKSNTKEKQPVLYIHGFIDYFFHPHVADFFIKKNYSFYALELRKYGHSILPHQHKNYCKNIEEYFEEIDICLEKIYNIHQQKIILLGHSTGGLISTLYTQTGKNKHLLASLILNSPFYDFNFPRPVKYLSIKLSSFISHFGDYGNLKKAISPLYCKSLHKDYEGEWDFNLTFKPINGFPAYFTWFNAIHLAHLKIKKHQVNIPMLILHSSKSIRPLMYSKEIEVCDIVLNIEDIKRIGSEIGIKKTLIAIKNAKHDVFLSKKEARQQAFNEVENWLKIKKELTS